MQVQVDELRPYLHSFDFRHLLVEGLGWDYYRAEPVSVLVDAHVYTLEPAAEKAGFVVYVCGPSADGSVPPYPVRRKIERQVVQAGLRAPHYIHCRCRPESASLAVG